MGQKVNLYLDDESLKMWKRIPSGQRSTMIKGAIREHVDKGDVDPRQEMMMQMMQKLAANEQQSSQLKDERAMLTHELARLQMELNPVTIDKDVFWRALEAKALIYHENKCVYRSYTGKSRYRIHAAGDDKIHIHNLRTDRTTSNFSQKTVDLALDRLIAGGGKVPIGQFIPVKMHEYAVVALHPRLITKEGYVHYLEEEMVPVDEEMIPDNREGETWVELPLDWTSNDGWLAVMVDGKRAHVCIDVPSNPSSIHITFHFIDEHPKLGDNLWNTWYYLFPDPRVLNLGTGDTQKILTPMIN